MSQDVTAVIKFVADDQTAGAFSSANRSLKNQEKAIQRVVDQQKKLTREAGKSADQIAIETLKRSGAKDEIIAQVVALQEERQAILQAKTARKEGINEVDRMIAVMKEQAATIGMSKAALAEHKAVQQGATAAQLASIQAIQAEIDAKQQETQATIQTSSAADQLIQKLQTQINTFDMSEDAVLEYKLRLDGATDAQIRTIAGLREQSRAMQKQIPLYQRMKQQLRFIRGGFGQVGHQVQDIAVQLQGGTDAMIVFGQQGSQIASLFGPGGAALGAILAVGAAAFTVFKNFELTTSQVEEMRREFEEFTPKTEEAQKALGLALEILAQQKRNNLRDQIAETTKTMENAVRKARLSKHAFIAVGDALGSADAEELAETIATTGAEAFLAKAKVLALKEELEALGGIAFDFPGQELFDQMDEMFAEAVGGTGKLQAPEIDESESLRKWQESRAKYFEAQRNLLTGLERIRADFDVEEVKFALTAADAMAPAEEILSGLAIIRANEQAAVDAFYEQQYAAQVAHLERMRQERLAREAGVAEHEAAIRESTLADFEASLQREEELREGNLAHMLDVLRREDEANEESAKKKADLAKKKVEMDLELLSSAQSLAGGLLAIMDKSSGAYKAMFAFQQALAIAQTVINTEKAAIEAIATFPGAQGITYSKAIRAMGYASVGLIAAQTVSSFEGGGFTGRGSRSGGIDGRGGFPAILHPNESVIDHEGGGMQPIVVNQTINVTTGVQQTVRAEIANLLPQISEAAKSAVADSRMRGGNFGGAMGA